MTNKDYMYQKVWVIWVRVENDFSMLISKFSENSIGVFCINLQKITILQKYFWKDTKKLVLEQLLKFIIWITVFIDSTNLIWL